jgi:hypothetical protein
MAAGTSAQLRIYPNELPQGAALPAIVYQRISTVRFSTHDDAPDKERLARPRIQLTCWAEDPDAAEDLGDEILSALSGLKDTIDGIRIDAVLIENDLGDQEPDSGRHRRIIDVFAFHAEN